MALIVENGSGLNTAESYMSVSGADTFHADRGKTVWSTLTTEVKEQLLRRASDYMVTMYRNKWRGRRLNNTQNLDWPRSEVYLSDGDGTVYPDDTVPIAIARVCAEFALIANSGPLLDATDKKVIEKTIGPITTKYDPKSSDNTDYVSQYRSLIPFLASSEISAHLIRC